ncbi:hypothetical protein CYMTET_4018 [Cymbomonas tetramitiformis]|uniref:N-acetyltransferase domain-containing protein n=1 Tax=Cymbomonas tetramitiformis TaxID=36881 RepID=A0AAE0H2G2_9CHLO|nr:hypothetical protein CYMTET_4018 [Cymbomonas tetramitiformis]
MSSDVRKFIKTDTEAVLTILANGFEELISPIVRSLLLSSPLLFYGVIVPTSVVAYLTEDITWPIIHRLCAAMFVSSTTVGLFRLTLKSLVTHSIHDYIAQQKKDDLRDISEFYSCAKGCAFWVYTVNKDEAIGKRDIVVKEGGVEDVVGCVALENKGNGVCELRRMSVDSSYRRLRIAQKLLQQLKAHACQQGYTKITLSTSEFQVAAQRLYVKHGFQLCSTTAIEEPKAALSLLQRIGKACLRLLLPSEPKIFHYEYLIE